MVAPRPPAGKIVLPYDGCLRFPDDGRRYELLEGEACETHVRARGLGVWARGGIRRARIADVPPFGTNLVRGRDDLGGGQVAEDASDLHF